METKYVKLQVFVKGEIVFEYVRESEQLDMSDVEIRMIEDKRCER